LLLASEKIKTADIKYIYTKCTDDKGKRTGFTPALPTAQFTPWSLSRFTPHYLLVTQQMLPFSTRANTPNDDVINHALL
jgi:hypothetical protein